MYRAVIKDNKAFCPSCNKHDYRITGYGVESWGAGKRVNFEGTCRNCNCKFEYGYICKDNVDSRF